MIAPKYDFNAAELFLHAAFEKELFNLCQVAPLNSKNAAVNKCLAGVLTYGLLAVLCLEKDLFSDCPAEVELLANRFGSRWLIHKFVVLGPIDPAVTKEDDVEEAVVEAWRVKCLPFIEVHNDAIL